MFKSVVFVLFSVCGLAGCADMASAPSTASSDQSQAFSQTCVNDEPTTGSRVRRKVCAD